MTEKYHQNQRTEEVQHIIERMPTYFGYRIGMIVTGIFILLMTFGWLIRYPDVLQGKITVNSSTAPIKLVANSNGKLKLLLIKSLDKVAEGQPLAYIENPTSPFNVAKIDSLLTRYHPAKMDILQMMNKFPHNVSIGELNTKYYAFYNALQELVNYHQDRYHEKQSENLQALLQEQKAAINTASQRLKMAKKNLGFAEKFYNRDSTLHSQRVISDSELDKSQVQF